MLTDQIISLILTQREQQRLNTQAKRLSHYNLDYVQLTALRERWESGLGYRRYAPALLASLAHLIEQLQRGEYNLEDYDEVVFQISAYNHSSWALLRQTWGSPSRYLDRWGKVHPEYRYAFEQTYEANTKLSVEDQAAWLRQLQSPSDVEPEKDSLTSTDDEAGLGTNVVDLAAYRQGRKK